MTTIVIGKRHLAVGLFWQVGAARATEARQRALALAEQQRTNTAPSIDFLCLRATCPVQYGVSGLEDGHRPGMTAAAAALADALPGSWAGIFAVAEGWYYVETRRGFIAPTGDRLFPIVDKVAASAMVRKAAADGRFDKIYAPAGFDIANAEDRPLSDIITAPRLSLFAANRLRSLSPLTAARRPVLTWKIGAPICAAIVGLFYAWYAYIDWSSTEPLKPALIAVWESAPAAAPTALACTTGILSYPTLPGYAFRHAECGSAGVSYHYEGYARQSKRLYAETTPPDGCRLTLLENGDLTAACPIARSSRLGRQARLTADEARRAIWRRMSGLGLEIKVSAASEQPSPPPGAEDQQPPAALPILKVDLTGNLPPADLAADFAQLPAMTIESIGFVAPRSWTIKGKLYVQ
ncbi:MAG TPA: type 4b pilus protein PilO2 [Rhodospirillaceae bacterium]|nr:type 4b pilus protein PilO2 [Rhodospirillaceae bacterium]